MAQIKIEHEMQRKLLKLELDAKMKKNDLNHREQLKEMLSTKSRQTHNERLT
jgi:hypothetical protein